jgi:hypothetical protein
LLQSFTLSWNIFLLWLIVVVGHLCNLNAEAESNRLTFCLTAL